MARRIALPSADELFGNGKVKPTAAAPAKSAASKPRKTASRRTSAAPKSATKPAVLGKKSSPRPVSKPRTHKASSPEARLTAVEVRLDTLPVDALIDLRDGISELLAGDTLDEAAVVRLLDSVDS